MRPKHPCRINSSVQSAMALLVVIFLANADASAPLSSAVNEAGLPVYRSGAAYIFSDGSWETVLNATADRVVWENQRGDRYEGSPDFTRRPSFWQNGQRQVRRDFRKRDDLVFKPPTSLWPLSKGKEAGFSEKGVWTEKNGASRSYSAQWACEVAGRETIEVPAGTFDTWKIECQRFSVSSNFKSVLRQVNKWYYAPLVGHYVLKESYYTSGKLQERMELVAVVPPYDLMSPTARQLIRKSFQTALEENSSDIPAVWQYREEQLSGETTPVDTFRMKNGAYCRRYAQTITQSQKRHTYFGLACRSPNGIWYVPQQ